MRKPSTGRIGHAADVYGSEQIAAFKERGYWLDRVLNDYVAEYARDRPDDDAVVDPRRRITWAQLAERVDCVAQGFLDLGLQPGDVVGLQLPNWIEFVEAYLGAQRIGLRLVTLMPFYRDADISFMLQKVGARALVTVDAFSGYDHVAMVERVRGAITTLEHILVVGEPGAGMQAFEDVIADVADAEALDEMRPDPDSVAKISFTSGTTGQPKGVVHSYNTDLVCPRMTAEGVGLGPDTPIWMPSPIAHATGVLFGFHMAIFCGTKLVLQDQWDPGVALSLIEREGAVCTVSATPFIQGVLDHPDVGTADLSSFKYFLSGGARIPSRVVERARDELGVELLRVFGMSEAPLHTMNLPGDPWEKKVTRDGQVLEGCEVRITDRSDLSVTLPPDEIGQYATRGPHVFLGYHDEPDRTAECFDADGWYFSGDLCLLDADGFVLYVDRIKDIINRGGVKISALEVENLLAEHPQVVQAAVVAMADERLGERACAFVVPRGEAGLELSDLTRFLEERGVTKQKWPERLEVVAELPSTATGKVQKNVLRVRLSAGSVGP